MSSNILVVVGTSSEVPSIWPIQYANPQTDQMTMMLVSPDGTILTESTVFTPYSMTTIDELEVLSDGSVVWGFVDSNKNFVFYKLPISSSVGLIQKSFKLKHKKSQVSKKTLRMEKN